MKENLRLNNKAITINSFAATIKEGYCKKLKIKGKLRRKSRVYKKKNKTNCVVKITNGWRSMHD